MEGNSMTENTVRKASNPKRAIAKVVVNTDSRIFSAVQVSVKGYGTRFSLRDATGKVPGVSLEQAYVERYDTGNCTIIRLISYGKAVAQVNSAGTVEILGNCSEITNKHIRLFIKAACGRDFSIGALLGAYEVEELTPINLKAMQFPYVTVGMINKALKLCGNGGLKVDNRTYNVIETYSKGVNKGIARTETLSEAYKFLSLCGFINQQALNRVR
jgi:hypothetical protein